MTAKATSPFNIKGLTEDQKRDFRTLAASLGKTQPEVFGLLLSSYQDKSKATGSNAETEALRAEVATLQEQLAALNEKYTLQGIDFNHEVKDLHTQLETRDNEIAALREGIEALRAEPATRNPQPTTSSFTVDPGTLKPEIQRAIAWLRKKGKISGTIAEILQEFTMRAIRYYLTNAFPDLKK
jgi:hypothetical protein